MVVEAKQEEMKEEVSLGWMESSSLVASQSVFVKLNQKKTTTNTKTAMLSR